MKTLPGSAPWARCAVGVDCQGPDVTVVRAERRGGGVTWRAVAPGGSGAGTAGRKIIGAGALLTRESLTRWVEVPLRSVGKAERVLAAALDIQLPFALEECVCTFLEIRRVAGRDATQALAVAARETDVARRVDELRARGTDPVVLDHEGLALWSQGLRERPVRDEERSGPRMVVYAGTDRNVLVVGLGEEYLGAYGLRSLDSVSLLRVLAAAYEPERARMRGQPQWLWVGPGARDPADAASRIRDTGDEWAGEPWFPESPETFLARAIAIRAVAPGPLRCNLRVGRLAHPLLAAQERRRSLTAPVLFLAAGLLVCTVDRAWNAAYGARQRQLDRAVAALADQVAGYHVSGKGEDAVRMAHQAFEKRSEEMRPFREAGERTVSQAVAGLLRAGGANGLRYETLSLSVEGVAVRGTAGDWNRCEAVLAEVRRWKKPHLDREEARAEERIPFTLTAGEAHE